MPPKTAAYYKKQKERDKKRREKEQADIQAEHDAAGSPGARKAAEARDVTLQLQKIQRNAVPIAGDGDCMYSSILHQMSTIGGQSSIPTAKELRSMVAEHMRRNKDEFLPFLPFDEKDGAAADRLDVYCREVEDKAWGTQLEVRASSEVLGKRIGVVTSTGVDFYGASGDAPQQVMPDDWCIVFLQHAFVLGGHFNSTRPGAAEQVSEQE